jgi:DNA-binding SARP family transcriptional activator/DNA-binding CsgD family transcriptional regulator
MVPLTTWRGGSDATAVWFTILGPVRVLSAAADLSIGGRQQRLVLALLLARVGSVVSMTELVDAIWDENPPSSAVNVVHRCIGVLRRLIEPNLPVRATGQYLVRQAAGYQLQVTADSCDLLRFRALVAQAAEAGAGVQAVRLYAEALALWTGRCAAGLEPTSRTHPSFIAIETERSHAVRDAADAALRLGQVRVILPALRQACGENPLDEALQARLLRALAADGRQSEAFDLFQTLRRCLRDELGVDPGQELLDAHSRLLHPDPPPAPAVAALPAPAPVPGMIGRETEMRRVRRLLADAAEGRGSAMLVSGTPGVGKSALLRAAAAAATERGFAVLSTAGVETEQWFPFAALHLLLQPVSRQINGLPDAHRLALRSAFGAADQEPDAHRIAFAVLELLADLADRQPLLLLYDDVQWLDIPSRDVLSFVARRSRDHAMLAIAAARPGFERRPAAVGLPELSLEALGRSAAAELLDIVAPGLTPSMRALILERSAGNPLALVELPKAVRDTYEDGQNLQLTQRLEVAFAARTDVMSASCRTFLLVMAAEPTAPLHQLLDVSSRLAGSAVTVDVLQEATDAGLIALVEHRPEFRHPLMRSAVYKRATVTERIAIHRALAAALDDVPERGLAHLAAATFGPDDELATRLEQLADDSQARGKVAAAVPALSQAAGLVSDTRRRTRILVRAAQLSSDLNDRHHARMLLDRADMRVAGPVERARLLLVSENAVFEPDEPDRRIRELVRTAGAAFDEGARDVAENLLWLAAARCFFQDADVPARVETAAEVDQWGADPDSPGALVVRAYAEPFRHGADVLARLDRVTADVQDGRLLHYLGTAAIALGDFARSTRYLSEAGVVWRGQGRLGLLARSLACSWMRVYLGQLDEARTESEEGRRLAKETGDTIVELGLTATAALVAVLRGETSSAAGLVAGLRAARMFSGMRFVTVMAQQVDGLLALFDGHASRAYAILAAVFDPTDPHHHSSVRWLVAPDLADAAVAADAAAEARKLLVDLPELARQLPSDMMTVAYAYTSAVLAPDDEADELFADGLAALPTGSRLIRARLSLQHGRRLHRQGRDARALLRAARDEFDLLGARPWAEMARAELQAAGEASSLPRRSMSSQLSAQQMQIATLAAQGLGNEEIAERLFISRHAVIAHLSHIRGTTGVPAGSSR